jgi:hypothetical protein
MRNITNKPKTINTNSKFDMNRVFTLNDPHAPRLSPALAEEIGLNESILFLQIEYWIAISNNERNGRRWTYQSTSDIKETFPFWSESTVKRIVNSLKRQDLIIIGNYNQWKGDKTRWFAINFEQVGKLKTLTLRSVDSTEPRSAQNEPRQQAQFESASAHGESRSAPTDRGSAQAELTSAQNRPTIPEITTEISSDISSEGSPDIQNGGREDHLVVKKKVKNFSLVEVLPPASVTTSALLDVFGGTGGDGSVAELSALIDSGKYSIEDVRGCGEWILTYFQYVPVSPESVMKYMPTYIGKRKLGRLEPWRAETASEKRTREWSDPEQDKYLAFDYDFS